MTQTLIRTKKTLSFYSTKQLEASHAQRKEDTRTKIQLGGLVIKSGLAEAFLISLGADLQMEEAEKEKATLLLGALIDLRQSMANNGLTPSQKEEWSYLGKSAFINHFLSIK